MDDEGCQACGGAADFSLEGDAGEEIPACFGCLAKIVTSMFDERLASGELTVYDVRPGTG
jgi:hypothetical protein